MIQTNTLVKAQKITSFKRSLAVVIGINEYQNKIPKLQTARRDAEVLAEILAEEHQYDEVILITDETECKPTLKNLLTLLEERLPKEIQPTKDDRLLFYFAGHGIARDSDKGPAGCLVPQDADLEKNENLLPMQKLHDCLSALSCRHLLIILDCCFAGTIRWSTARLATVIPTVIRKEHYDRFIKSPAWQAITSAAHNQEALDTIYLRDNRGGVNHSPFALALFKALRGEGDVIPAAKNGKSAGDGVISATELYLYLRDNVETASNESQTPGIWTLSKHDKGEYIFLVPGADPKLKPAPKLTEKNNPYRGLQSFEEEHSQLFFGRKELVEELYKKVSHTSSSLTVVLGVSGSGKSSLVKAGLIPYLRQHNFREWYILKPMRPSESPFTALARTLLLITNNNEIVVSKQLDDLHFIDEILQQEITDLNQRIDDGDINSEEDEIIRLEEKVKKYERFVDIWKRGTKETKQRLIVDYFDEFNNLCHDKNEQKLLQEAVLNCLNPLSLRLHDPNEFLKIVKIWSEQRPGIRLLLVIDQFEELITLSSQSKEDKQNKQPNLTESQQFLKLLEATLAANLPQLSIVVTLRSDFEPRFLNSEALKSYWTHARFPIRAMRSDELRQAIELPAAEMALYFEQLPGQQNPVDKLVDEVGQMPGALPLLSFTLSQLYTKLAKKWEALESSDRALILDAEFDKEGGVAGSLTQRANKEYDELPDDAHRATMRRVMLRMVTIEGGGSARRRVPSSELVYADKHDPSKRDDEENQRVELVLKRLTEARLIVRGQETGEPYVEPAHDFLVKSWNKLQEWQQQEQEDLTLQRRLTPNALEWKNKEQSTSVFEKAEPILSWFDKKIDSTEDWVSKIRKDTQERQGENKTQFLWNGNPYLDVLRKKLKSVDYWFNQVESEFVQQSVWQRRRNVNLGWSIAIGVTVVSLSLTAWALSNLRQALIQQISAEKNSTETAFRANQLTFEALTSSLRAGKSLKSLFLPGPFQPDQQWQNQVLITLQKAVYQVKELNRWQRPQGEISGIFLGQDDKVWIAVSNVKANNCHKDDISISLWDSKSQQATKLASGNCYFKNVSFSPDGSQLAIVGPNKTIHLCGLESKHCKDFLLEVPNSIEIEIESVSFSGDGKSLAFIISGSGKDVSTGGKLHGAYLWNLQSREGLKKLSGYLETQGIPVKHMRFSSDDHHIVEVVEVLKDHNNSSSKIPYFLTNIHFLNHLSKHELGVTANNLKSLRSDSSSPFYNFKDVILSSDGNKMVTIPGINSAGVSKSKSCYMNFWDLSYIQANSTQKSLKDFNEACSADFNPNPYNNQLAIGGINGDISFYDSNIHEQKLLTEWKAHEGVVENVKFSSDGKRLITIGEDGTIRLWNTQEEQSSLPSLPIDKKIESISVSPNGQQIALIDSEHAASLWDVSHQTLTPLSRTEGSFTSVIFDPDGKHFAGAKIDNTIIVFDISGKLVYPNKFKLPSGELKNMIFRPDRKLFIIIEHDRKLFYSEVDFSKNNKPSEIKCDHNQGHTCMGYTFNDDKFIVANLDIANPLPETFGTVDLQDFSGNNSIDFKKLTKLSADFKTDKVAFNIDGNLMAITQQKKGEPDGTVMLWDIDANQIVKTFKTYSKAYKNKTSKGTESGAIKSLSLSADGSILAILNQDGKVMLWHTGLDELLMQGCQQARNYLKTLDEKNSDRHLCDN